MKSEIPSAGGDLPGVLRFAGLWIIFAAWASLAGWILSALHRLDAGGYLLAAIPGLVAMIAWWRLTRPRNSRPNPWQLIRRRLKHPSTSLPFFAVAILILAGAVLHAPTNHDGLTYRLPRLLYWLQEGRWHWLASPDFRMDIAGVGAEWMSAPLLLLTGGDRLLFLLNYLPFLLFPGLFYQAAAGLGVSPRRARYWMWAAPLAYGIALQAGSIGNDALGGFFALAALAFAAKAPTTRPSLCLGCSLLAVALMTGIKVTALPLALPIGVFWLRQAWVALGWRRMMGVGIAVAPVAVLTSFLPIAVLCWHHAGAWNGNPDNRLGIEVSHPVAGLLANGFDLVQGALVPPVFPGVGTVDRGLVGAASEMPIYHWIQKHYPAFDPRFVHELPTEESAGLGVAVVLVGGATWVAAWKRRGRHRPARSRVGIAFAVLTAVAVLAFLAKAGGDNAARLMLPFAPAMILAFLVALPAGRAVPSAGWIGFLAVCLLPSLFLNPNRPLVPGSLLGAIPGLPASITTRMQSVYSVYAVRNDLLAPLRPHLPLDETVAFAGIGDRSSYSLFRPFGRRRVVELTSGNLSEVHWIVGTGEGIAMRTGESLENGGQGPFRLVHQEKITDKVSAGPEIWQVWRRRD